ncbi:hypothetical protein Dsin_021926 [Dipteronia sinensis]|uniref:Uncharacterized protein n=1 Tax=Dipteronia sinensis TaxID=43782 RepID=A0AAE0A1V8_9ROSI|nr:hypothetical protein Dsin_021926 [Dipteronia sinensis]
MVAKGELRVSISKKEVVAAELPLQEHWLPLSNMYLLLPAVDVGVLFCYQNTTSHGFGAMVGALKKAMAKALVSYYALAGEMVPTPLATQLKCGGLVVGCTFDHRVADAYSANMFLVSWADMAQSKPIFRLPSFRRSLLNPKRPGCVDPTLDDMYVPTSTLPPPKQPLEDDDDDLISRIYYVTIDQLNHLQSLATSDGHKRTKWWHSVTPETTTKLQKWESLLMEGVGYVKEEARSIHG